MHNLAEIKQKIMGRIHKIFTKTDHIGFHKKQFDLKGNWKIDYTNTKAMLKQRWSNEWKKYIPRPF